MVFRKERRSVAVPDPLKTHTMEGLHEWVLSLPWVVERPYSQMTPGVRSFAVECEPLDRRQLWLVTGLIAFFSVAVIVPTAVAREIEMRRLGREIALMPRNHVLLGLTCDPADEPRRAEQLILTAYSYVMA